MRVRAGAGGGACSDVEDDKLLHRFWALHGPYRDNASSIVFILEFLRHGVARTKPPGYCGQAPVLFSSPGKLNLKSICTFRGVGKITVAIEQGTDHLSRNQKTMAWEATNYPLSPFVANHG